MKLFLIFFFIFQTFSKTQDLSLRKLKNTSKITKKIDSGKLVALGKEWSAEKYCNEATISNAENLEAYQLSGKYEVAILCTGLVDGEENVVSVFSKNSEPKTKKILPAPSSNRITETVLKKTVSELTK